MWMRERKKYQENGILSLVQPTAECFCARTCLGWCFCVCVSLSLFHQSASINSSNTARLLRSIMCYITSSKCTPSPHQHQQLGCYLLKRCEARSHAPARRLHARLHYSCSISAFTRKNQGTGAARAYQSEITHPPVSAAMFGYPLNIAPSLIITVVLSIKNPYAGIGMLPYLHFHSNNKQRDDTCGKCYLVILHL